MSLKEGVKLTRVVMRSVAVFQTKGTAKVLRALVRPRDVKLCSYSVSALCGLVIFPSTLILNLCPNADGAHSVS